MASTILNEHGWDPDLIEVALAHVDKDEVRSAYNRADYIDRRRPLPSIKPGGAMSSRYAEGSLDDDRVGDCRQTVGLPVLLMPSLHALAYRCMFSQAPDLGEVVAD